MRHSLLKASFIPSREQRELREITRYRKSLTKERSREWNRLHKVLENFARVDMFKGRSYREVLTIAGAKPNSIVQKADGGFIKIWKEAGYSISLEFDERDICLGVLDELY